MLPPTLLPTAQTSSRAVPATANRCITYRPLVAWPSVHVVPFQCAVTPSPKTAHTSSVALPHTAVYDASGDAASGGLASAMTRRGRGGGTGGTTRSRRGDGERGGTDRRGHARIPARDIVAPVARFLAPQGELCIDRPVTHIQQGGGHRPE